MAIVVAVLVAPGVALDAGAGLFAHAGKGVFGLRASELSVSLPAS